MTATKGTKGTASHVLQPRAVLTGLELAILQSVIAGGGKSLGDLGVKGAGALVNYLRDEGPMAHRVLASWTENTHHVVALEFVNTTVHGGYVEALAVTKPEPNLYFDVARPNRKRNDTTFGAGRQTDNVPVGEFFWKKQADELPLYLAPGESSTIVLRLTDDQKKVLSRADTAEFSYEFSIVGGKEAAHDRKKNTKRALVRLRRHGPKYL